MHSSANLARAAGVLLLAGVLVLSAPGAIASRLHVAADANGLNDGSSWVDGFTDLQGALAVAVGGDQIWVKEGTYRPSPGFDYTATFQLPSGVALYGGFQGIESALAQRDWSAYVTVLDGYLGMPPDPPPDEDCGRVRHVVTAIGVDSTTTIDGFTIRNGGNFWGYRCEEGLVVDGGGMYVLGGRPTIANINFEINFATGNGAGLYVRSGTAQLVNVAFLGNSAAGAGGGLYTEGGDNPTLESVTFAGNHAAMWGGGYACFDTPLLRNVTFSQNTAGSGGGMSGIGTFNHVAFTGNLAEQGGGGGCAGGGIFNDVQFVGNSAREFGGGLSGGGTLTNVSFIDNNAFNFYASGGGLFGTGTLTNVLFSGNSAVRAGGGMHDSAANGELTNVVFVMNRAESGGGLYNGSWAPPKVAFGTPSLVNVTFMGNTASQGGGALYNKGVNPLLTNCILWGDAASTEAVQEIENSQSVPVIASSLIKGCAGSGPGWNASLGSDGGGNLDADPLFVATAQENLRLSVFSPAVDRGDTAAIPSELAMDMDGNPRIFGVAVDMGAYELQMTPPNFVTQPLPAGGILGASRGAAWGDYDDDGDDDLFVARGGAPCLLLRNDGPGALTDAGAGPLGPAGEWNAAAWGDFTDDGRLDLYVTRQDGPSVLYWNGGPLGFFAATPPVLQIGGNSQGAVWVDFDNDGDLDLYVTVSGGQPNRLYRQDGPGSFVEVTGSPLNGVGASQSAAWADYDNDGDQDLYLAKSDSANQLFRNDGAGQFVDVTTGPLGDLGQSKACAWGDFDNDGDLDLYVCNADGPNHLLRNDRAAGFVDVTPAGLDDAGPGSGVSWLDYDNDGWLDLYFANAPGPNHLLRNDGNEFLDVTTASLVAPGSESATCVADYDNDGDQDLFVASEDAGSPDLLLRNDTASGNHWLRVALHGTVSNRFGVGARLRVVTGVTSRIRELNAGHGLRAQDSFTAHFGLGQATMVDTLEIQWPSGIRQFAVGIGVDQPLQVLEDASSTAAPVRATRRSVALYPAAPNPFNPATTLRFELPAAGHVRLRIYDVAGRLVRTVVDEERPAGEHRLVWDGRGSNGSATASGVYHARLEAGGTERTVRLVLVR